MMGGDQVYADSIWEVISELREWAGLPVEQAIKRLFTADIARKVDRFYSELYIQNWGQKEPASMLARIPTLMMWDDHDIFEGWASEAEGREFKSRRARHLFKHLASFLQDLRPWKWTEADRSGQEGTFQAPSNLATAPRKRSGARCA